MLSNSSIISNMGIAGLALIDQFAAFIADGRKSLPIDQIDPSSVEALHSLELVQIDRLQGAGQHRTASLTDKGVIVVAWYASQKRTAP